MGPWSHFLSALLFGRSWPEAVIRSSFFHGLNAAPGSSLFSFGARRPPSHAYDVHRMCAVVGPAARGSQSCARCVRVIIDKDYTLLDDCDLLIGILDAAGHSNGCCCERYGRGDRTSSRREEAAMLYLSSKLAVPQSIDVQQLEAVHKFRGSCEKRGLLGTFDSTADFRDRIYTRRADHVARRFIFAWDPVFAALLARSIRLSRS